MKKAEWIDYIKLHVGKIDPTRKFHKGMIEHALAIAYENLAYNTYRKRPYELDTLTVPESLTVQYDSAMGRYYVELDYEPILLDRVGSGVVSIVYPLEDYYFVPAYLNEVKHILRSEVMAVSDEIMFTVLGTKIYFINIPSDLSGATLVVNTIKPLMEFGMNDNIPIPASQTKVFFEMVLQMLQVVIPEQTLNNNTDTSYGTARSDKAE